MYSDPNNNNEKNTAKLILRKCKLSIAGFMED
jgi:hypothetical protein